MDEETEDLSETQPLGSLADRSAELPDDPQSRPSANILKSKASLPSCSPAPGSAVSALQSKVKAVSQRKLKGTERENLLPEGSAEESVKKNQDDEALSTCQKEYTEQSNKPSAGNTEVLEPISGMQGERETCNKNGKDNPSQGAPEMSRGLCEGSSLENIAVGVAGEPQGGIAMKSTTSSPRHWAPPKGFWRVARPETLLLNSDISSTLATPKDVPPSTEEGLKRKPKLKTVGVVVHKELQRSDSLESAFRRYLQKEIATADPAGGLWKADSWETVCTREGSLSSAEKVEMNKTDLNKYQVDAIEINTSMHPEGQYQPHKEPHRDLPPYKVGEWDSAIITRDPVFNYRPLISTAEVTLSPRHEQAKRLLERARFKARSQNHESETPTCLGQREGLEVLPISVSSTLHSAVLVTAQKEVTSPLQSPDIRGRNHERGMRSRRYGQSPTRVRFEDESEKEAKRRYLERVRERGPVVAEKSHSTQQLKSDPVHNIPEESRGAAINWVNIGIPVAILTKEGECLAAMVSKEDMLRTCEACGSILGPAQNKDCHSQPTHNIANSQEKAAPRWVTPGQSCHRTIHPTFMESITFTGGISLAESVGRGGVGGAGENTSAFGKLRRRSRKGESRVESGNGPYARSQDLWAQRRNSKTRSSLEDKTTRSKLKTPEQGATETSTDLENKDLSSNVKDSPPHLPIKSALKSSSKCRPTGQRVVKLMPSVQYRLIHLDHKLDGSSHHDNILPEEHLSVTLSASPQVHPVTSGLTSCNRPSSLRYSTSMLTTDLQALAIWDSAGDLVTGHLAGEGVCRDPRSTCTAPVPPDCRPALRAMGTSKAEDLRAELLRAEHRKAEIHWDDSLVVSRRAGEREGRPKLSLRRFFSAMGLNSMGKLVKGSRSNSMEHLCSPTARYSSASPSPTHRGLVPLKRTPSLQSLHTESPLAQLRKASSVQSLQSPKRKFERSTILGELPLPLSLAPRELQKEVNIEESLEDSRGAGPLGRLVQAFPDGTLLIELTRPANNRPFGFVISRGKGRPDSGIYVERVGDSATENIYTGLLGVGDEILEVNGEILAGLTLDQVTRLMTRDSKATIRILPHSWVKH
uniref:Si:ch211-13f8.1 n=1 Tax=Cyprinus carpio carpio TaxID=630221 RepID=A0A9J8CVY8_CYPCA